MGSVTVWWRSVVKAFANVHVGTIVEFLDRSIGRSTISTVALGAAAFGLLMLLGHLRRKRREEGIRAEVRAYLGTNSSLAPSERNVVEKLLKRIELLEQRADGVEHDIRVIANHLQTRQNAAPAANGIAGPHDGPKPLTRAA